MSTHRTTSRTPGVGRSIPLSAQSICVHQRHKWEIGNFINCTPAIQTLSRYFRAAIPVVFDTDVVADMFLDCPFIHRVGRTKGRRIVLTSQFNQRNVLDHTAEEEWRTMHRYVSKYLGIAEPHPIPHTYVDVVTSCGIACPRPYVVLAYGCLGTYWLEAKDPGVDTYVAVCEHIAPHYDIIMIGSDIDKKRLHSIQSLVQPTPRIVLNDIRASLALLNGCEFFVGNDTGMAHVAGALHKPSFLLWKDTPLLINKSPSTATFYSHKGNWLSDFPTWVTTFINKDKD